MVERALVTHYARARFGFRFRTLGIKSKGAQPGVAVPLYVASEGAVRGGLRVSVDSLEESGSILCQKRDHNWRRP